MVSRQTKSTKKNAPQPVAQLEAANSELTSGHLDVHWREHRKERFERIYALAKSLESSGQLDDAANWCDTLFELADDDISMGRSYVLKATVNELQGKWRESLDAVYAGLRHLGMTLPEDPDEINRNLKKYTQRVLQVLEQQNVEELLKLPPVSDDGFEVLMKLLFRAVPSAVQINPPLFMLADLMLFDLTVQHGTTAVSPKNFVDCGIIVGSMLQKWETGYELGLAAYSLLDRQPESDLRCGVEFVFATYISHWKEHFKNSIDCFERSIVSGLETGDLSHTSYAFIHLNLRYLFTGLPLSVCDAEIQRTIVFLENAHTNNQTALTEINRRTVMQLLGNTPHAEPNALLDAPDFVRAIEASNNAVDIGIQYQLIAWIAWLQRDYDKSLEWSLQTLPYVYALEGMFPLPDFYLVFALSIVEKLRKDGVHKPSDTPLGKSLVVSLTRLEQWAKLCPANFAHKHHLAQAESLQLTGGDAASILAHYSDALSSISADDFLQWQASIHAHRAEFHMRQNDKTAAARDLKASATLYRKWEADALAASAFDRGTI